MLVRAKDRTWLELGLPVVRIGPGSSVDKYDLDAPETYDDASGLVWATDVVSPAAASDPRVRFRLSRQVAGVQSLCAVAHHSCH